MPNLRNGSKGDSNPGSLDCESGILPLSCRAPYQVYLFLLIYLLLVEYIPGPDECHTTRDAEQIRKRKADIKDYK